MGFRKGPTDDILTRSNSYTRSGQLEAQRRCR